MGLFVESEVQGRSRLSFWFVPLGQANKPPTQLHLISANTSTKTQRIISIKSTPLQDVLQHNRGKFIAGADNSAFERCSERSESGGSGGKHLESGGKHLESGGKHLESGGKHLESGGKRLESGGEHSKVAGRTSKVARPVLRDVRRAYEKAKLRVILLDYDVEPQGVLRPDDRAPDRVLRDKGTIETLKRLASDPKNQVWIMTARVEGTLPSYIRKIPNLKIAENHGTCIKVAEGQEVPVLPVLKTDKKSFMRKILGEVIESKSVDVYQNEHCVPIASRSITGIQSSIHQPSTVPGRAKSIIEGRYHVDLADIPEDLVSNILEFLEAKEYLDYSWIAIPEGLSSTFRIRLICHDFYNKGTLAQILLDNLIKQEEPFFAISFGDSRADEPMHKAMNSEEQFSVFVTKDSTAKSSAYYELQDDKAVKALLKSLTRPAPSK
ncbi:hypothetical protein MJO28_003546 [Puccinia striiformis f. sp. tritici]|uniref:Uncharacterized protein n=1 Tax=Puccinia striiformis f. sp. tritici TaxID=168172 RepID=A0ACC0EM16_9BASI|nr:hypothetical protein MJO28_003546 [Puccinia striiformis f. sp. tritici]